MNATINVSNPKSYGFKTNIGCPLLFLYMSLLSTLPLEEYINDFRSTAVYLSIPKSYDFGLFLNVILFLTQPPRSGKGVLPSHGSVTINFKDP